MFIGDYIKHKNGYAILAIKKSHHKIIKVSNLIQIGLIADDFVFLFNVLLTFIY